MKYKVNKNHEQLQGELKEFNLIGKKFTYEELGLIITQSANPPILELNFLLPFEALWVKNETLKKLVYNVRESK